MRSYALKLFAFLMLALHSNFTVGSAGKAGHQVPD